jgi:hypothetical protein
MNLVSLLAGGVPFILTVLFGHMQCTSCTVDLGSKFVVIFAEFVVT